MILKTLIPKLLGLTIFSYVLNANASDDDLLTQDFQRCIKTAGAVDPAILECQSLEFERQDRRLNTVYRKLIEKLDAQKAKELKTVQRTWLSYAEAKCRFYYDDKDRHGSLDRLEASFCEVIERARRAEELENIAQW